MTDAPAQPEPTNDQVIAEVDGVFGEYLRLLAKESPVAARCTQGHCIGLINALKIRLLQAAKG